MKNWIRQFKDIQNHNWHTSFFINQFRNFYFTVRVILSLNTHADHLDWSAHSNCTLLNVYCNYRIIDRANFWDERVLKK